MNNQSIPDFVDVIFAQLGGCRRLEVMVGAYNFSYSANDKYVSFRFKACKKCNYVSIKINELDLYDIEFWKLAKDFDCKITKQYFLVSHDKLIQIFESETGLYLRL